MINLGSEGTAMLFLKCIGYFVKTSTRKLVLLGVVNVVKIYIYIIAFMMTVKNLLQPNTLCQQ